MSNGDSGPQDPSQAITWHDIFYHLFNQALAALEQTGIAFAELSNEDQSARYQHLIDSTNLLFTKLPQGGGGGGGGGWGGGPSPEMMALLGVQNIIRGGAPDGYACQVVNLGPITSQFDQEDGPFRTRSYVYGATITNMSDAPVGGAATLLPFVADILDTDTSGEFPLPSVQYSWRGLQPTDLWEIPPHGTIVIRPRQGAYPRSPGLRKT